MNWTPLHRSIRRPLRLVAAPATAVVPITVGLNALAENPIGSLAPYIAPPGAFALFGAAFWVYDEKLWRGLPFGLELSSIPDLSRQWKTPSRSASRRQAPKRTNRSSGGGASGNRGRGCS